MLWKDRSEGNEWMLKRNESNRLRDSRKRYKGTQETDWYEKRCFSASVSQFWSLKLGVLRAGFMGKYPLWFWPLMHHFFPFCRCFAPTSSRPWSCQTQPSSAQTTSTCSQTRGDKSGRRGFRSLPAWRPYQSLWSGRMSTKFLFHGHCGSGAAVCFNHHRHEVTELRWQTSNSQRDHVRKTGFAMTNSCFVKWEHPKNILGQLLEIPEFFVILLEYYYQFVIHLETFWFNCM